MKRKLNSLWLLFFVLSSALGHSQTCTITSADYTCLNEPISFTINSTSTIASAAWNFGNGNTSTQLNPLAIYDKAGSYTVTLIGTSSTGGTCTDSKTITVYDLPTADFKLADSSEFCLTINKICLIDSSKKNGTNAIKKAGILWDDGGKTDNTPPSLGQVTCYEYSKSGKYTIEVEVEDDKGCKDRQDIDLEVLEDKAFSLTLSSNFTNQGCDSWDITINNDSAQFLSSIDSFYWDLGDGTIIRDSFNQVKYSYTKKGTFDVVLYAFLSNGCAVRGTAQIKVDLPITDFDFSVTPYQQCYPLPFSVSDKVSGKFSYTWEVLDTAMEVVRVHYGKQTYMRPLRPGKFYVRGRTTDKNCTYYSELDSFESVGVLARYSALNGSQCTASDTVFFLNTSITHGTYDITWNWSTGDTTVPPCTDDALNFNNCRWGVDRYHYKHFYKKEDCYRSYMLAVDNQNGCRDSTDNFIAIQNLDDVEFFFRTKRACIGLNPDYGIEFYHNRCLIDYAANFDSACSPSTWLEFSDSVISYNYPTLCDTSGWVTVGFVPTAGDSIIFHSADTSDYTFDGSKFCTDTIWKHKWFKLQRNPSSYAVFNRTQCLPVDAEVSVIERDQDDVSLVYTVWGDGTIDTASIADGDTIPTLYHTYTEPGDYFPRITVQTDSGCTSSNSTRMTLGYINDFYADSIICPGMTLEMYDTLRYFSSPTRYWRDTMRFLAGIETLIWDFDDGKGFDITGPTPQYTFEKAGLFEVKMASKDLNGCLDTATRMLLVADVEGGIKKVDKKVVCEDVIQLFDSSFTVFNTFGDTLIYHFWDFGDGKTPSFLENPFHFYETPGEYDVTHIVSNTRGCSDTVYTKIIIDGPKPNFNIISDTVGCVPFTAQFENTSTQCSDYIWFFGDANGNTFSTKTNQNVSFTYTEPGIYYIKLLGSDSVINPDNGSQYFCSAFFPDTSNINSPVRRVVVLPIPEVEGLANDVACYGQDFTVEDNSDSIYDIYQWYYQTDSLITNDTVGSFVFSEVGQQTIVFKPRYIPTGPYERACFQNDTLSVFVRDFVANIEGSKPSDCAFYELKVLNDTFESVEWSFDYPTEAFAKGSRYEKIDYNSYDTGWYTFCATVVDTSGCINTACDSIYNDHFFYLFLPNIITPNGDGLNDYYDIDITGEISYDLAIYNRWGETLYQSKKDFEDEKGNWNGLSDDGLDVPSGVYFYIFNYKDRCNPDNQQISGTITVTR
jgi:gliding motility-associated-like protein